MFKQTIILLAWGVIGFGVTWGTEPEKPVPASLDEATTFEEIQAYVNHVFTESRKDMKTLEDQERFYETYAPVGIAAGRKIIALGGSDESLEYGYRILFQALNLSGRKHPENAKEFEKLYEELKASGKFPDVVALARFWLFFQRSRSLSEKIPKSEFTAIKNEFDTMKEEAKELTALKMRGFSGQLERTLDMAQEISVANDTPRFLDEVLEDLVRFLTSDRFERKKENESFLRGYCRRMTGSPFELWGKTVDGNDFNWNDYKGKVVLIDFTASWCGPCREEMPNVVEMYNKYHSKGLEVVCIGYKDTTDNLKKMIEEDKVTFPMISEELSEDNPRGLPSDYYGIRGIPNIFLVGKDGRIVAAELRGPRLRDSVEKQFLDEAGTKE
jgi:thiol-disulfide isomerase/thioredoxin